LALFIEETVAGSGPGGGSRLLVGLEIEKKMKIENKIENNFHSKQNRGRNTTSMLLWEALLVGAVFGGLLLFISFRSPSSAQAIKRGPTPVRPFNCHLLSTLSS
jgi:hypothetical protein